MQDYIQLASTLCIPLFSTSNGCMAERNQLKVGGVASIITLGTKVPRFQLRLASSHPSSSYSASDYNSHQPIEIHCMTFIQLDGYSVFFSFVSC